MLAGIYILLAIGLNVVVGYAGLLEVPLPDQGIDRIKGRARLYFSEYGMGSAVVRLSDCAHTLQPLGTGLPGPIGNLSGTHQQEPG